MAVAANCTTAHMHKTLQGCSEQTALEGQDLPRTYLARHELESIITTTISIVIIITHAVSEGLRAELTAL